MESIQLVIIFVHAEMNEDSIVDINYPHDVTLQLCDWAKKVGSMTLLLMHTDQANTDDCPTCWGCSVPLAESLSLISHIELAKSVESPKPVHRKNFISWMVVSMLYSAVAGTPKAWKTRYAMACAILS